MPPDFSLKTIENLGKRAAFLCSNPDCRAMTVGPNSKANSSTTIGEAAHICGARPSSARYVSTMSDLARAEITNAIWLCRNCHKKIDGDADSYSAARLFSWREEHERYVTNKLGTVADRAHLKARDDELFQFDAYPPIIKLTCDPVVPRLF
ncbi:MULTISPECIES: hypothetical protein [Hyphobacterium]|uniref:HNH endonuclease n=1 Tax=Hyphobacterium vulgare TaxID=1736751 RepID=A0ABV6ZW30_9PROT